MSQSQFDCDVEEAIKYAKHSLEIEGQYITQADEALIRAYLKNEISHAKFIEKAKELAMHRTGDGGESK